MTFSLDNAIVYDIESFPNCFTFSMEMLRSDTKATWEISEFRDDSVQLMDFFRWLSQCQVPMIGFNNINYDYPICHMLYGGSRKGYIDAYQKTTEIIEGNDKFGHIIWADNRFAPQIDLFKLHHFDNRARSTGLKSLQINMRSESVVDMPVENGTVLTKQQIDELLIPYNLHDVTETKRFTLFSEEAIQFRINMIDKFGLEVLNWNDTKIGEQTVIQKLGDDLCYDRSSGKRKMRQTPRSTIALKNIIFPYIKFDTPEFKRVHEYMSEQVLRAEELSIDEFTSIKTKGVFTDLSANLGGVQFHYGVGGIHGSVENKRIEAGGDWIIRDIDVAALYPSIAIKNNLAPHHLGAPFVKIYSELPKERKRWQVEKGKKCPEANALKLASNGVYGKSNSIYSVFYDPQFTMSVTINGQLLLSMLIEKLIAVPTLRIIQANTDGVTYYIDKNHEPEAARVCSMWEIQTMLTLESTDYKRMWIKDVNNYIAESLDGSLKLKGAYWTPDPCNYHHSIADAQPVSWHKNFSNVVSVRAAVAHMVHGVDIEMFIRNCINSFDFMCAVKVKRSDLLLWGLQPMQRNTRFYISTDGESLVKRMPSVGPAGQFKKANDVPDHEYKRVMNETGGQWDERVCTKNKSKYEARETAINAGYKVTVCNDSRQFRFDNVNYNFYINESKKLLVI